MTTLIAIMGLLLGIAIALVFLLCYAYAVVLCLRRGQRRARPRQTDAGAGARHAACPRSFRPNPAKQPDCQHFRGMDQ